MNFKEYIILEDNNKKIAFDTKNIYGGKNSIYFIIKTENKTEQTIRIRFREKLQPISFATIYADKNDIKMILGNINMGKNIFTLEPKKESKKIELKIWNGESWIHFESKMKYKTEPEVGYCPIEYYERLDQVTGKKYASYHFGTEIINIYNEYNKEMIDLIYRFNIQKYFTNLK